LLDRSHPTCNIAPSTTRPDPTQPPKVHAAKIKAQQEAAAAGPALGRSSRGAGLLGFGAGAASFWQHHNALASGSRGRGGDRCVRDCVLCGLVLVHIILVPKQRRRAVQLPPPDTHTITNAIITAAASHHHQRHHHRRRLTPSPTPTPTSPNRPRGMSAFEEEELMKAFEAERVLRRMTALPEQVGICGGGS
jgi:hypothetical protein